MANDEIPKEVRVFLLEHIESYTQLEILTLLYKQSGRNFSSEAVAAGSSIPESVATTALEDLHRSGVLEMTSQNSRREYRYSPRQPDMDRTVEQLLQFFNENPIAIVKLMNATVMERVRTSAMRAFANAFVLRGKKDA